MCVSIDGCSLSQVGVHIWTEGGLGHHRPAGPHSAGGDCCKGRHVCGRMMGGGGGGGGGPHPFTCIRKVSTSLQHTCTCMYMYTHSGE